MINSLGGSRLEETAVKLPNQARIRTASRIAGVLLVGSVLRMLGFMGAVNRYVAGASAPMAKNVVNYVGVNTEPRVKAVASAIAQGVREGQAAQSPQSPEK